MHRRSFVRTAAAASVAPLIVPRHVLGGPGQTPPSERVNVAGIGAGGMGGRNILAVSQHGANIVALCDVDDEQGRTSQATSGTTRARIHSKPKPGETKIEGS